MIDLDDTAPDDLDALDESAPVATDTRSMPLRYSVLKLMGQSPAHARDAMLRGGGDSTIARRFGSASHALLLGGAEVRVANGLSSKGTAACADAIRRGAVIVQYDGAKRQGKKWDQFVADNASADLIALVKEYEQAMAIIEAERSGVVMVSEAEKRKAEMLAESVKSNEVARRVLFAPKVIREERIDWTWNGRAWRSTPDARDFRVLAELKTTRCADPAVFWRDALRMGYHVQLAIYRRAIEQTTGVRPGRAYLFAVESVRPYVVTPFQLTERSLEHGWRKACEWHERFLDCEARNEWPGYVNGLTELDVYDPEAESEMEVARAMADDDGTRASVAF